MLIILCQNAGIKGERPQGCGRPFSFFKGICLNGNVGITLTEHAREA